MTHQPDTADLARRVMEAAEKATPGPWYHCQPFMTVPATRTIHGPVPAERVDYVSTWPGPGTPPGHRTVLDMPGRESRTRSEDMAFIALSRTAAPALAQAVLADRAEIERLREVLTEISKLEGTAGSKIITETPSCRLVQTDFANEIARTALKDKTPEQEAV